ncbi:MAG: hypothetical protein A2275_11930 [Bacteroidetes bacterium RIFOXYA12_FULL_35_11]|nr:MAG: hypothetical protein A2X01_21090 [Bacteroidetes bacterium GWF2_35_48]OFY81563.1 MAG: hypothetical protein A2275_11930 [Bacteroidetes bacterium RIFOXYA12_FULL_35_11]OFY94415.1 MAG: hypothetical protein A2491_00375 [Bacteroidetes bacterium RIFOXYC12_FULL_35_7]
MKQALTLFVSKFFLQKILIFIFLFSCINTHAQDLSQKITLKVKNKPLSDVIHKIENLSAIRFSYSPDQLPVSKLITIHLKNKTLQEIFDAVFLQNDVEYLIVENQVILKKRRVGSDEKKNIDDKKEKESEAIKPKYTINGYLRDKSTGEILIGANIFAKGTILGAATNAYGYFSLTLPEGKYILCCSYIGFKPVFQELNLTGNQTISFEMESSTAQISEVQISADDPEKEVEMNQSGEMKLTPKTLSGMTGFVGETDIIKSLQSVSGIKAYGDGSTLFYVRGGNSDQNMILIDDAPIYNPAHLFGFFSAIAPDAIKDIEAYKGDFPASYGGRLSSMIDIRTKDGNMKQFGMSGSIGPFTSTISFEGPVWKDRISYIVSARRANMNWIQRQTKKTLKINFYDLNAKLNFKINNNNRIFLTLYRGADEFSRIYSAGTNTFGISWDNFLSTLRWNHIFSQKLFSNTTAYISRYNYYLYISKEKNEFWNSEISNFSFKTDFTWYANTKNTIKTGIHCNIHSSNPGNVEISDEYVKRKLPAVAKYQSREFALYGSNEQVISEKWSLRYGIRVPLWQDLGETKYFTFNDQHIVIDSTSVNEGEVYKSFLTAEPRINVKYSINKRTALKASYTRNSQFLHMITNSVSPFTSMEVWIPSGSNIKPSYADQFSAGYFKHFSGLFYFSGEIFFKHIQNQIDYADHASLLFNPAIEGELRQGISNAYGTELMIRKQDGNFTGWIGYTYSRSIKNTLGINNGNSYVAAYDRPHDVCINISYKAKKHWLLSANWLYMSGSAFTSPVSFYYFNGYTVPVYGDKNNDRLPAYHRMDISVTYSFRPPEKRFQHNLIFTLYNAYAHKNPVSVNFTKILDDNGKLVVPTDLSGQSEIIPTMISVAGVIPSVTYNFKF